MRISVSDVHLYLTASTRRPWERHQPVLLGLHGGPGIDGSQLRYLLQPQEEWATVVVPDQRGHGHSDRSVPASWTLEQWAEDVHLLVQALGLDDVVLVGTSFGGFVVQRFLSSYPGAVRGGVIVGSSPRRASEDEIVERYRHLGGDGVARVMERTLRDPSPEAEEEWAQVCAPFSRLRPPDDVLAGIARKRTQTPEVNEHFMATFADVDLRDDLRDVRDPVLVLVGAADPLTPPQVADEIRKHSGGKVTVHHVPEASHQVLWDQPERSDRLLRDFVTSLGLPA